MEAPASPDVKKSLLVGARALAEEHLALFEKENIDPAIFHNDKIEYSAIQIGSFKGKTEWVAVGEKAVRALELWYGMFQKELPSSLQHVMEIREYYTPAFLSYMQAYRISPLLVKDDFAIKMRNVQDKFARFSMMEKYLYGNLQTFFEHISFAYDKEEHFLKIEVGDAYRLPKALPVYHGNKKTAFRVSFRCNFRLPYTLRLGQAVAIGYGKVQLENHHRNYG